MGGCAPSALGTKLAAFTSNEVYPIQVSRLCSLQLCDCHTRKSDSVVSISDDHCPGAGVMRLTEHLRRCVMREQSMIERKLILSGVEVCNRFLAEALVEYKSIVSCPAD
jgi:hypothetical protein